MAERELALLGLCKIWGAYGTSKLLSDSGVLGVEWDLRIINKQMKLEVK